MDEDGNGSSGLKLFFTYDERIGNGMRFGKIKLHVRSPIGIDKVDREGESLRLIGSAAKHYVDSYTKDEILLENNLVLFQGDIAIYNKKDLELLDRIPVWRTFRSNDKVISSNGLRDMLFFGIMTLGEVDERIKHIYEAYQTQLKRWVDNSYHQFMNPTIDAKLYGPHEGIKQPIVRS